MDGSMETSFYAQPIKIRRAKVFKMPNLKEALCTTKRKPSAKSWKTSKRFQVYFGSATHPLGGLRIIWAVVGIKWVRICHPICGVRHKIKLQEWQKLDIKEI